MKIFYYVIGPINGVLYDAVEVRIYDIVQDIPKFRAKFMVGDEFDENQVIEYIQEDIHSEDFLLVAL